MDLATVGFLASPEGESHIGSVGVVTDDDLLSTIAGLRRTLDRSTAAAVVETARLRVRATEKFSDPTRMLFTAPGLEQATPEACARLRANRFRGQRRIVDMGCGIGADALALSDRGSVVAMDVDPVTASIAAHNLRGRAHVVVGDALSPPLEVMEAAVFIDPARRDGGRRIREPERWSPPLDRAVALARRARLGAVKVAPGLDHGLIPHDASAEWVSLDADLRECVLWFGTDDDPAVRSAVDAGTGERVTDTPHTDGPVAPIGAWLHEPDPAVIRSGLVANLAERLSLHRIDHRIAYLSGSGPVTSALVRSYEVESVLPFNLKALRSHLRELGVGSVTIKKRGSPLDPEDVRRRLDLGGDLHRVVVLTRVGDDPVAVVAVESVQSGRAQT